MNRVEEMPRKVYRYSWVDDTSIAWIKIARNGFSSADYGSNDFMAGDELIREQYRQHICTYWESG